MSDQDSTRPNPSADALRAMVDAFQGVGLAARKAAASFDRFAIADHPELGNLNHEFNNLYGGAFEDDPGSSR